MGKKILIVGGTGFIGGRLISLLLEKGYEILVLTRELSIVNPHPRVRYITWEECKLSGGREKLAGLFGIINLAGENIGRGRWTTFQKKRILYSRVQVVRALVDLLKNLEPKPVIFIQASAVGYYGPSGNRPLDETSSQGKDFLARVCRSWEGELNSVEELGVHTVIMRLGMVLDSRFGALPRLLTPFRFFMGGPLGKGSQWVSWIHVTDVIRAVVFILSRESEMGIFNLCSPQPVTNEEMARTLGKVLNRPAFFRTPAFVLRLLFGEKASALLLRGQQVLPVNLLSSGFTFRFVHLYPALMDLLARGKGIQS